MTRGQGRRADDQRASARPGALAATPSPPDARSIGLAGCPSATSRTPTPATMCAPYSFDLPYARPRCVLHFSLGLLLRAVLWHRAMCRDREAPPAERLPLLGSWHGATVRPPVTPVTLVAAVPTVRPSAPGVSAWSYYRSPTRRRSCTRSCTRSSEPDAPCYRWISNPPSQLLQPLHCRWVSSPIPRPSCGATRAPP